MTQKLKTVFVEVSWRNWKQHQLILRVNFSECEDIMKVLIFLGAPRSVEYQRIEKKKRRNKKTLEISKDISIQSIVIKLKPFTNGGYIPPSLHILHLSLPTCKGLRAVSLKTYSKRLMKFLGKSKFEIISVNLLTGFLQLHWT